MDDSSDFPTPFRPQSVEDLYLWVFGRGAAQEEDRLRLGRAACADEGTAAGERFKFFWPH